MLKPRPKTLRRTTLKTISVPRLMADEPEEWAVLLALLGFSARCIADEVGLRGQNQVYYLLRKREVRLRDYRNGLSPMAQYVIRSSARAPARSPVMLSLTQKIRLPAST